MKLVQLLLSVTAVVVAAAWAWHSRSWDSYCAVASALVAVSAVEFARRKRARTHDRQGQAVARDAIGIQAGRDVSISGRVGNDHE